MNQRPPTKTVTDLPDDVIRWGVIGCGDVVRKRVATALATTPGSRLVAACRRDATALDSFCDAFGVAHRFTGSAALLASADVDAVYIATPVACHAPQTIAAAAAGKHVLVEKPMAISAGDCDQMITACETAGVKLGVAYYRRFYPIVSRIKQLIRTNEIGQVIGVSAATATPMKMNSDEDGFWRWDTALSGGGSLMDVGSHRINVFLELFGSVRNVKCISRNVAKVHSSEDANLIVMEFDSGVVGTLQSYFGCDDPDSFRVFGTDGSISATPLNGDQLKIVCGGRQRIETHPPAANFADPMIADFVDAIRRDHRPRVDGHEGRMTSRVIDDAYRDAAE